MTQHRSALRKCSNHDPNSGPGSDWCPNCGQYATDPKRLLDEATPLPSTREQRIRATVESVIAECIGGDDWIVMWDDGSVREFRGRNAAEKAIRATAENRVAASEMLVTRIEWRP